VAGTIRGLECTKDRDKMWISSKKKYFGLSQPQLLLVTRDPIKKNHWICESPVTMRVPEKRFRKILISNNLDTKILITEDLERSR
jgi:hypothetical protein